MGSDNETDPVLAVARVLVESWLTTPTVVQGNAPFMMRGGFPAAAFTNLGVAIATFARQQRAAALEEAAYWFATSTCPTEHSDSVRTCIDVLRRRAKEERRG